MVVCGMARSRHRTRLSGRMLRYTSTTTTLNSAWTLIQSFCLHVSHLESISNHFPYTLAPQTTILEPIESGKIRIPLMDSLPAGTMILCNRRIIPAFGRFSVSAMSQNRWCNAENVCPTGWYKLAENWVHQPPRERSLWLRNIVCHEIKTFDGARRPSRRCVKSLVEKNICIF